MKRILVKSQQMITKIDWWFVGAIAFLITLGLVVQYSIGLNQDTPNLSQFYKQFVFVAIGGIGFFLLSTIDHRVLKTHPIVYAGLALFLLIAVLLFGTTIKGATGWFVIAGFSFQPVEFVKLLFILFMATYFEKNLSSMQHPRYFFASGGMAAILVGCILLQPDTGSALILFLLWFVYVLLLKAPKPLIALVVVVVLIAFSIAWFFLFPDYQKDRLTTFLNPYEKPFEEGYNVIQSMVAVGSGSWWGRGLGLGTQSQLHFLPEVSADFIFAVIAEELGFVGVCTVLCAISIVLFRLWKYISTTKESFGFLFCIGTFTYIIVQSFMVIGMNIGILPVTGVPLPLVSAGGSSMLMTLIILGIAHNIGRTIE